MGLMMLLGGSLTAQTIIQARLHRGPMLKIHYVFPEINQPVGMMELGIQMTPPKSRYWHSRMGYPSWNLHLQAYQMGNREILGHAFALMPSFEFSLYEGQKIAFRFRNGTTLAYLTQSFDRSNNRGNNVLGSPWNILSHSSFHLLYRMPAQPLSLVAGGSFSHFSNGRLRVPNLGANIPAIFFGIQYGSKVPSKAWTQAEQPPDQAFQIYPSLRLSYGFTALKKAEGPLYPEYVGAFALNTTFRHLLRFQLGTEWFISGSSFAYSRDHDQIENQLWLSTGGIFFAGVELMMGHFSAVFQVGPYLKKIFPHYYASYSRIGVQFYLHDQNFRPRNQWFLGAYIHAHGGEADFLDIALGYVF